VIRLRVGARRARDAQQLALFEGGAAHSAGGHLAARAADGAAGVEVHDGLAAEFGRLDAAFNNAKQLSGSAR
jgi:hypothetical protein